MFLRRLRDVTQKTYFLRCFSDALKTSEKIHLFSDVSERSLRYLSQWRSDGDLTETSHADWVNIFMLHIIRKSFYGCIACIRDLETQS